jgi:site-specific recombinase XerD
MSASLHRKLNRSKGRYRTKQALTKTELKTFLAWTWKDRSIKGQENYAIVLMLVTSGLRASEICQLSLESLCREEGRIIASFIGKGGRASEQELHPSEFEAANTYIQAQFRRSPDPCDWLF